MILLKYRVANAVAAGYDAIFATLINTATAGNLRLEVHNYCTPASGPLTIMNVAKCGFDVCGDVDLIISEFSINSGSTRESLEWYSLLMGCDVPVIVLNLFSWLQGGPALAGRFVMKAFKNRSSHCHYSIIQRFTQHKSAGCKWDFAKYLCA